jgi:hypothetical protein
MIKRCPQKNSVGVIAYFAIALLMVFVFPPTGLNAKQVVSSNGYAILIEQTPVDGGGARPRDPVKRSYAPFNPFDTQDDTTPEPATLLIFGVGSLMVMKTRRKKTKL